MMTSEDYGSVWDHVYALRHTIIRCLLTVVIGIVISFIFYDKIFALLTSPFEKMASEHCNHPGLASNLLKRERLTNYTNTPVEFKLPLKSTVLSSFPRELIGTIQNSTLSIPPQGYIEIETAQPCQQLVVLSPIEGMIIALKLCVCIGIILTSPIWLLWIFRFVAPAFEAGMHSLVLPFLALSFLFILAGFVFAFLVTIPIANQYLYNFNLNLGVNLWSLSSYLNYTLALLIANGCMFECCAVLLFLVHFGIVSPEALSSKRRHMIVAAFILAALLTPPDVLTQVMLAVPLIIIYEFAILYGRLRKKMTLHNLPQSEGEQ